MVQQKDFPSFSPKAGGRSHDRRWFLHDTVCYSYPCTPHNIDHKEDMHQKRYFPCHKEVFQNSIPGTAGGARNVRIMTAPVPLRLHFFKTGGTDGNIGRCKHFIFAFPAGNGSKSGKRRKRSFFSLYALHKGRPFHLLKPAKESVYLSLAPVMYISTRRRGSVPCLSVSILLPCGRRTDGNRPPALCRPR